MNENLQLHTDTYTSLKVIKQEESEKVTTCFPQTEKVEYISYIKDISNKAARNAEMSLFCKQTGEAEGTLLQAGLVYRAIRLNVDLFRWNRYG